jgi:hypothetical protein
MHHHKKLETKDKHSESLATQSQDQYEQEFLAAQALLDIGAQTHVGQKRKTEIPLVRSSPIDQVLSYPKLLEHSMNCGDPTEFLKTIGRKCEEGIMVFGHYVDQQNRPIYANVSCCWVGVMRYFRQIESILRSMPDVTIRVANSQCIYKRDEIIISSKFSLKGTYLEYHPQSNLTVPQSSDDMAELMSQASSMSTHSIEIPDLDALLPCEQKPLTDRTRPSVLGQFVPSAVYEVPLSPNGTVGTADAMQVSINGRMIFHVNRATQLIRRIDATYVQQDERNNSSLPVL